MDWFEGDLAGFADDWRLSDLAESTLRSYLHCLRKYGERCSEQGAQTLSIRDAKRYLVEVRSRSASTACLASRALKAYSRWYAREYDEADAFAALAYVSQPKPTPQRTTSVADVQALLATCADDMRGIRDRALILVLASTGARRGEIVGMRWDDVDMTTAVITFPRTKAGRPACLGCRKTRRVPSGATRRRSIASRSSTIESLRSDAGSAPHVERI